MRDEYDFSNAVRGKFYRKDAVILGPLHLEARVLAKLCALAESRGKSPADLVVEMLDRETSEAAGVAKSK
jgi:hypothetical protein